MEHDPDRQEVMGESDHPQHRAPPGEGFRATPETGEDPARPEYSIFDGAGNESVVVSSVNEEGEPSLGTGPDRASARADAESGDTKLGEAFSPGPN